MPGACKHERKDAQTGCAQGEGMRRVEGTGRQGKTSARQADAGRSSHGQTRNRPSRESVEERGEIRWCCRPPGKKRPHAASPKAVNGEQATSHDCAAPESHRRPDRPGETPVNASRTPRPPKGTVPQALPPRKCTDSVICLRKCIVVHTSHAQSSESQIHVCYERLLQCTGVAARFVQTDHHSDRVWNTPPAWSKSPPSLFKTSRTTRALHVPAEVTAAAMPAHLRILPSSRRLTSPSTSSTQTVRGGVPVLSATMTSWHSPWSRAAGGPT